MAAMSRNQFRNTLFIFESILMACAAWAAFVVRFDFSPEKVLAYPNLLPKIALAVIVTQLCAYYNDLYTFNMVGRFHELVTKILQGLATAVLLLLSIYYAFPAMLIGRGAFALMILLFFVLLLVHRTVIQVLSGTGYLAQKVLVLGSGTTAVTILKYLSDPQHFAHRLAGLLEEDVTNLGPHKAIAPLVGSYKDLFHTAQRNNVEVIIVALEDRRGRLPLSQLADCKLSGMRVLDPSQFWEEERGVISVRNLRPSWLIFSDGFRQSQVSLLLKEVSELIVALCAIVIAAPIMALISVAIRLDSPGPILFRQVRVGAKGRIFTLLKFRSMYSNAETSGVACWAKEDDPRVTRVGRFTRKYRLDELPQLFNVIRGEMSLVGPRPERPQFVDQLLQLNPCYAQRLAVKPGVTGLAQVRMRYAASVDDSLEKLEYDLYYVKHLSISLDLSILLDTFKVVLMGKGAR